MGRHRRREKGGRGTERSTRQPSNDNDRPVPPKDGFITDLDKHNKDFEEYYKAQNIVPEGEWDEFMACIRKPLPVTFRINGSGPYADDVRDRLQAEFFSKLQNTTTEVDGEVLQPPRPLPWYPNNYGWHMNFSRNQLRKLPVCTALHEYMKKAHEVGVISRQEAVSMVPPMFLDVQPHHQVLDMCAAPGSKTFQLLEALHTPQARDRPASKDAESLQQGISVSDVMPSGFVIANDADNKRCHLLTHQLKRMCSTNLLVTNLSAEMFPILKAQGGKKRLLFDRILCDVPCSGDGTIRKAPDIWRRWAVGSGNGLHILQLRIALRGIQLLKVGGRMVYSTCTFNPIEDEAVIAEVLRTCGSAIRLVDVSAQMPELKRSPGKTTWRVKDKHRWYDSWEEAKDNTQRLEPSMFPQPDTAGMPLHHCMRFLPHQQDTGGFFLAVIEKVSDLPEDFRLPQSYRSVANDPSHGLSNKRKRNDDVVVDPLSTARLAAEAALAAAKQAVQALEAGDTAAVDEARSAAQRAAGQAGRAAAAERATHKHTKGNADGEAAAANSNAEPQVESNQEEADVALDVGAAESDTIDNDAMPVDDVTQLDNGMEMEDDKEQPPLEEGGQPVEDNASHEKKAAGAFTVQTSWVRGGTRTTDDAAQPWFAVDPIAPIEDVEVLKSIREAYALPASFPLEKLLITRNLESTKPKKLYLVNESVLEVILMDRHNQLRIVSTGLKVFDRHDIKDEVTYALPEGPAPCTYRLTQEALATILPFVNRQRLQLTTKEFLGLLKQRSLMLPLPQSSTNTDNTNRDTNTEDGNGRSRVTDPISVAQINSMQLGCVVCELRQQDVAQLGLLVPATHAQQGVSPEGLPAALAAHAPLAVSGWKGRSTIALMVDKMETLHLIDKIESARQHVAPGGGAADAQ